ASLGNAFLHVDWNQASIDSNRVCRDGDAPGDYVQWNPLEMAYLHDWNALRVDDGRDWRQILAAQQAAKALGNGQPTAIVYRTTKGWRYGIEGRASHGAGHKFCSPEFYASLKECEERFGVNFPHFEGKMDDEQAEAAFWKTLLVFRGIVEKGLGKALAASLVERKESLARARRVPRPEKPDLGPLYAGSIQANAIPPELTLKPGSDSTLRGALGDTLSYLNKATKGAILAAAADLLGSTSVSNAGKGFAEGFYNSQTNPGARLVATGGICEDTMGAFLAGVSTYGAHIGVGSSYAAFIAALQHVAGRLHGIGQQARHEMSGDPMKTMMIVCAHAGLKTGEDGPTHADPQALQLLQENFPKGVAITLTPWEPQELWPLTIAGLAARPAVLAPFVTRPTEKVPDRGALGIPPATMAAKGIYALRTADPKGKPYHGTIVLQESGVAYAFVDEVLPKLHADGLRMNVYLVTSAELFDLLPIEEQHKIFPPERAAEAMGITGFTMPTMYRWVGSDFGRAHSLHAFWKGRYPGSGQAAKVLEEAGLDGASQYAAAKRYAEAFAKRG
ncbi:MAG: hypothetical protein QUU85_04290, partial [Candidatus Eisenbacteria bacterium]|nr:hypothetical protein [Candidatus Eisenbacteria bacterium]